MQNWHYQLWATCQKIKCSGWQVAFICTVSIFQTVCCDLCLLTCIYYINAEIFSGMKHTTEGSNEQEKVKSAVTLLFLKQHLGKAMLKKFNFGVEGRKQKCHIGLCLLTRVIPMICKMLITSKTWRPAWERFAITRQIPDIFHGNYGAYAAIIAILSFV